MSEGELEADDVFDRSLGLNLVILHQACAHEGWENALVGNGILYCWLVFNECICC